MPVQLLIVKSGTWVIGAGIALLAFELYAEAKFGRARVLHSEMSGWKARLRTTYAGIVVIAIGAALEALGALAFKNC